MKESGATVEFDRDAALVEIDGGSIRGTVDANGVRSFLGVPYAAPPVGARRWLPPQPVSSWEGVRPAQSLSPQCLQAGRSAGSVYAEYSGIQPMSEDCLYLNVWSAAPSPDARWPVMVWIHGGAFQQGAGSNPVFVKGDLPNRGVVLVTFNYRLGPFGFMAHPDLTRESPHGSSGNFGLLDMAAALEWVQRNIAAFGGDPKQVTLFGQSAGAAGVVDMMAARRTRGLFARAIAQSFGITQMRSLAAAESSGAEFAGRIGAPSLSQLRALDGVTLLQRYLEQSERWMPIVDGNFIERPVGETFRAGQQHVVPLLTGWNADEGSTFVGRMASDPASALRAARIGDQLFAWGVWRAARDHARIAPTWLYHFDHPQPFLPQQQFDEAERAADLGVFHSSEYPYIFGSTGVLTRAWTGDDRRMTGLMQACWLAFATTGDPNHSGLPQWPPFHDGTDTVLRLAPQPELIDVPRRAQLALAD